MTRTRVILGILMGLLVPAGTYIHSSSMAWEWKLGWEIALALLFLTAVTVMVVTFFSLDQEGRVPYGSLIYKYCERFYGKNRVPLRLNLCPMYWMLFLLNALVVVVSVVACVALYAVIFDFLRAYSAGDSANLFGLVGWFFIYALAVYGLRVSRSKVLLNTFVWVTVLLPLVILFYGAVTIVSTLEEPGFNYDEWLTISQTYLVATSSILLMTGAVAILALTLYGLVFGAVFLLKLIGIKSFFSETAYALYHNLCPSIPVEPAPQNSSQKAE